MVRLGKSVQGGLGVAVAVLIFCASSATAARITSPNYQIDGNLGGSFGGETNSSSYRMTALGGEAIVGNGSSGSYILDQQESAPDVKTMQLGVQPSGLVGFYPMDENTGTSTSDASRYQNDGTVRPSALWNSSGKIGSAIDFNGPNDSTGNGAVSVPDHAQLPSGSQMTFEAWINSRDPSVLKRIATNSATSNNSWKILQIGNDVYVYIADSLSDGSNNYTATSGNVLMANAWQHVAVIYDGSLAQADRVKVYINGVRVVTSSGGTIPPALQNSTAPLTLGGDATSGSALNGSLDHAKLFNRALTAAEIRAEYDAQNAGASTGFGLEPTLNESTASTLDAVVRTNADYVISIQQDGDLQSGANTIPAIGGSISTPVTWNEGATRGLGFTLTAAPVLDGKWGSGSKYAAIPNSVTAVYSGTGSANKTAQAIAMQLRLHPPSSQVPGAYSNTVTYTGTMTP